MAGRIPREFIDDLLARVDIVEVIDRRVPLTKKGREYMARCPFHEEKTPSFTVSQNKQFYHCFGCGAHGTAVGFLMEYSHVEFPEAIEELAGEIGLEVPREGGDFRTESSNLKYLLKSVNDADHWYRSQLRHHPKSNEAIQYLKQRGLSGEIAARFGIGYAPDGWDNLLQALGQNQQQRECLHKAGLLIRKDNGEFYDRFRHRVMFPIEDYRGRIVGFGGRVLDDSEPKYLNSPETPLFHKGNELYGLHKARGPIKHAGGSIVVEGYMDVIALAQFGVENAVATLGTATTRAHLDRLFRFAPEITFCFDGDRAGRDAAWKALDVVLPEMQDGRQVGFLFLPEGDDPDSLIRREGEAGFRTRVTEATSLPDFLFQTLAAEINLSREDGRARLVEQAKPFLNKLPQGVLHELMCERLARLAQMDTISVIQRMAGTAAPSTKSSRQPISTEEKRLSPVALAISLLVQQPAIGQTVRDCTELDDLDTPGVPLLLNLLTQTQEMPDITTAALVERFRGTTDHPHLEKLAAWNHLIGEDKVEAEFRQTMTSLQQKFISQQIDRLEATAQTRPLNADEKQELTVLHRARHISSKSQSHLL